MPMKYGYLGQLASTTAAASYATTSYIPSGNALLVAFVHNTKATLPDIPTYGGNNLSWTNRGTVLFNTAGTPLSRLTVFSAATTGGFANGPSTGLFGANQTACFIGVSLFSGVILTGKDGQGGILQMKSGVADATVNASIALNSPIFNSNNAVIGCFANDTNSTFGGTAEAGWTQVADGGTNNPANGTAIYLKLQSTGHVVSVAAASSDWGGFVLEINSKEISGRKPLDGNFRIQSQTRESFLGGQFSILDNTPLPSGKTFLTDYPPYEQYKNFAFTYTTGSLDYLGQVLTLATPSNTGLFPKTLPFKLIRFNVTDYPSIYDDPYVEILNVTGRFSSGFYVTRAQEGTFATGTITGKNYGIIQSPVACDYENKWKYFANPDNIVYLFDDFDWGSTSSSILGWTTDNLFSLGVSSSNKIGGLYNTATNLNSSANIIRLNNKLFRTDSGPLTCKFAINPQLATIDSNPSLPIELRWGLGDTTNSGELPANGLFWNYLTTSGSGMYIVSAKNSTYNYTRTDLGPTVETESTPYREYKIVLENSGIARFLVNNVEVSGSPIVSNIPWGSGQELGVFSQSISRGAITTRTNMDYVEASQELTGLRTQPLLMTDLVSYWPLYETSGTGFDSHGSNHLTAVNNPIGVSGKIVSGRFFNSSNTQWLSGQSTIGISGLTFGTDDGQAIWLWIYPMKTGSLQGFVNKYTSASREYTLGLQDDNTIFYQISSDGTAVTLDTLLTTSKIVPDSWNFIYGQYNPLVNQMGLSINNEVLKTLTHLSGFFTGNSSFGLGIYNGPSFYFSGIMSEVGIARRPLTTGERNFLFNNSGGMIYPFNHFNEQ